MTNQEPKEKMKPGVMYRLTDDARDFLDAAAAASYVGSRNDLSRIETMKAAERILGMSLAQWLKARAARKADPQPDPPKPRRR